MTDPDYAEWLKLNPAPDLQALVARFGTYSAITPEAWAEHDVAMTEWEHRRKNRLGKVTKAT